MRKVDKPHAFEPIQMWVVGDPDPVYTDWCSFSPDLLERARLGEEIVICAQLEPHPVHQGSVCE